MTFLSERKAIRGFTLVEIIVAVSIVAVLASIVIANVGEGRKKARDTQRISDLEQIQLALRLYKDANGSYPDCRSGMVIGESATPGAQCTVNIDDALRPFMTTVPKDPKSSESNYDYVYDSDYNCTSGGDNTGNGNIVLFVKAMEQSDNYAKWQGKGSTCRNGGPGVTANSYGIILK